MKRTMNGAMVAAFVRPVSFARQDGSNIGHELCRKGMLFDRTR